MGSASCLPLLPGYVSQPVSGFHDKSGRFAYQLNMVYRPPSVDRRGIEGCRVDQDLSYWSVSWSAHDSPAPDDCALGRWLSHDRARTLHGTGMTFERFCSVEKMRELLPGLLRMDDVPGDERSSRS